MSHFHDLDSGPSNPQPSLAFFFSCGSGYVKLIHGASLKGSYKFHWHMQMWVIMRYVFHRFTLSLHPKIMPSFSTASDGCSTIIKHHPLCSPLIQSWNFGIYPLNGLSFLILIEFKAFFHRNWTWWRGNHKHKCWSFFESLECIRCLHVLLQ